MKILVQFCLSLCLLFALSCGSEVETQSQVLLVIDADNRLRTDTTRLEVALKSGPPGARASWKTHMAETFVDFRWPASLALVPSGNAEQTGFEVLITAFGGVDGKTKLVTSRVISAFLEKKRLLLEVVLDDECIDYFECGMEQTCSAQGGMATCTSANVDPKKLPEYRGTGQVDDPNKNPNGGDGDGDGDGDGPGDAGTAAPDAGSTDSGTPPGPCAPGVVESCFNGKDDDCNGKVDCEDDACDARAMCVPGDERGGVLVAVNEACPDGYKASETEVHRGPVNPGCGGCSCSAANVSCTASAYFYERGDTSNASHCINDTTNTGGMLVPVSQLFNNWMEDEPDPTMPVCPQPIPFEAGGFRVTDILPSYGACTASGTAQPLPATWTTDRKLCRPAGVGSGCGDAQICVPRATKVHACGVVSDVTSCATPVESWFLDVEDTRSCGECSCASPSGGNCNDVRVQIGSDWSCRDHTLSAGAHEKVCEYRYSPPVYLVGTPVAGSCAPTAETFGDVTATGRMNLCCVDR